MAADSRSEVRVGPSRRRVVTTAGAAAALALGSRDGTARAQEGQSMADVILRNGKIAMLDRTRPEVAALAIKAGIVQATGAEAEIMALAGDRTQVIDLRGRRAVPGLNDSHTHLIRGGLNYNMELRWEGVPSLADG
jgi:imidazolonepropionase-like amidohydrolase